MPLELSSYDSLKAVIERISDSMSLPSGVTRYLMEWSEQKHWLTTPSRDEKEDSINYQSFEETFTMSDEDIIKRGVGTRQGDRTPSIKTRNLIIGWCAEEIIFYLLRKNPQINLVELIGTDRKRVLVLNYTPTDPDLMLELKIGKKLMVEVVSISKETSDNKVRIKYNKIKQNEKRFFSLKKSWIEYFLVPTIYIAVDMVSYNQASFILGGEDFYGNNNPYPFGGWENQLVVEFDTINKRLNCDSIQKLDLRDLQEKISKLILSNNPYMDLLVKKYGNFHYISDTRLRNELKKFTTLVAKFSMKVDEFRKKISYEESEFKDIISNLNSIEIDKTIQRKILTNLEKDVDMLFNKGRK